MVAASGDKNIYSAIYRFDVLPGNRTAAAVRASRQRGRCNYRVILEYLSLVPCTKYDEISNNGASHGERAVRARRRTSSWIAL